MQRGSWVNSSKEPRRISQLSLGLTGSSQLPVLLLCPSGSPSSVPFISYPTSVLFLQVSLQHPHCSGKLWLLFIPCCLTASPRLLNASPQAVLTSQFPVWFSKPHSTMERLFINYLFSFSIFFLLKLSEGIRQALSHNFMQKEGWSVAWGAKMRNGILLFIHPNIPEKILYSYGNYN